MREKKESFIINKEKINIAQTLKCGQIFSYRQISFNPDNFIIFSSNKKAEVYEMKEHYKICTDNVPYFQNFFDLETDYEKIKSILSKDKMLVKPIEFGGGIRILRQDLLEVIISFVFSANNNIKRITESLFALRQKFGKHYGDYAIFPSLKQLSEITAEQFKEIGAGYRAEQLVKLIEQLQKINFDELKHLSSDKILKKLIDLSGIGPKVADCILLFGFNRTDVFPVDTWIEKAFKNFYESDLKNTNHWSRAEIRKFLTERYGNLAGYAQQYLFNYQRNFHNRQII
ncbi:MAG: DNA glycosylase [Clostridia bacterium]|nr:DNA glycosylase [Clostridia bacterium]